VGLAVHWREAVWATLRRLISEGCSIMPTTHYPEEAKALAHRVARSRSSVLQSLSRNSYGIYLVHYAFVSWLQLALVGASMPATLKFAMVTVGAKESWLTTTALRRVPVVPRVV
jgi:hypothetical protein